MDGYTVYASCEYHKVLAGGNQEFIFLSYSIFCASALQGETSGSYYIIVIETIHDNKSTAEVVTVFVNAPIAPWV